MHLHKYALPFILSLFILQNVNAQVQVDTTKRYQISPKREFRGVWIATVENIDWPKPKSTVDEQKQQLTDILDAHQETGINAVFFQVRPCRGCFLCQRHRALVQMVNGQTRRIA